MDRLMAFLEREAFSGYTWQEVLIALAGAIVISKLIAWIFKPRFKDPHKFASHCPACGWHGRVSRHTRQCPRCNTRMQ